MLEYARTHKRGIGWLALMAAAAIGALNYGLGIDEGRKKHIKKQLSEAAAMPGRLLT
ncbi:MAG: hypothetical protein ACYC99_05400 [Candidatus Geothermincolia bacterium]